MFYMISYSWKNQLLDGMLKVESVSIAIFIFMLQLIEILRMDVRYNHFLIALVQSFYILNWSIKYPMKVNKRKNITARGCFR